MNQPPKLIKELIPKHKADIETVKKLKDYSYQEIKDIVPELLVWIQDMNWPVAGLVADYLESISGHITDDIVKVLKGDDEIWKYWCISIFGINSTRPIAPKLMNEFERIANNPTEKEVLEEVQELAKEFVNSKKFKWTTFPNQNKTNYSCWHKNCLPTNWWKWSFSLGAMPGATG